MSIPQIFETLNVSQPLRILRFDHLFFTLLNLYPLTKPHFLISLRSDHLRVCLYWGLQIVPLHHLYEDIYLIMNSCYFFLNLVIRSLQPNNLKLLQTDSPRNFISFSSHSISISHNSHTNSKTMSYNSDHKFN